MPIAAKERAGAQRARVSRMKGVITTRHLLTHFPVIISHYGLRCYLRCLGRCLLSNEPVTFLDCIRDER